MLKKLTPKQEKVLSFYVDYIGKNGTPPTYAEAGEKLGVSPSVVFNHIRNLQKAGVLDVNGRTDSINFIKDTIKVPLMGAVACGEPIDVYEEVDEYIDVPKSMMSKSSTYYALKAKGRSMINVGIDNGDTLLIRKQDDVDDGEIAVVIVTSDGNERATLKRVYHQPTSLMLKAENDDFPSIYVKECLIRGKLVGVIRKYN